MRNGQITFKHGSWNLLQLLSHHVTLLYHPMPREREGTECFIAMLEVSFNV